MAISTSRIEAIETHYNGFHFRSRAEARYAIFFDLLGIQYEYEPEKFDLPSGRYIPDFRLSGLWPYGPIYFEVKGGEPSADEISKPRELSHRRFDSRETCFVAYGNVNDHIIYPGEDAWCCVKDAKLTFGQCIICGQITITCLVHRHVTHSSDNCSQRIRDLAIKLDIDDCFTDFTPLDDPFDRQASLVSPMITLATEAARSARFESPEFIPSLDHYKQTMKVLKSLSVFGTATDYAAFYEFGIDLSRDPSCPRYEFRRQLLSVG